MNSAFVPRIPGLAPAPYAHAASVSSSSRLIFTAGACPLAEDGVVAGESYTDQALLALENLRLALEGSGASLAGIVQLRVLVASTQRRDVVETWDALAWLLGNPAPPSTLLGVTMLGYPDQLVELEAVAAVVRGPARRGKPAPTGRRVPTWRSPSRSGAGRA